MVVFRQSGCIREKVVVLGKVDVLGKNWFYSGEVVVFGKSGGIQARSLYSGKSGFIRAK